MNHMVQLSWGPRGLGLTVWSLPCGEALLNEILSFIAHLTLDINHCKCYMCVSPAGDEQCYYRASVKWSQDASSHENGGSKCRKYDQIIAVTDAAITAPQLSGTVIRKNMQLADGPSKNNNVSPQQSVQRHVYAVSKHLTKKQLNGYDSFGALIVWCERNHDEWHELVRKHNDPADSYHHLFDFVVI